MIKTIGLAPHTSLWTSSRGAKVVKKVDVTFLEDMSTLIIKAVQTTHRTDPLGQTD